ncbi:extracellular solute-binding protein [Paenibacillus chungangensis]|uniref:Extracellular solute-binding protein n=1 Tax=Paenibacillus chungangensis TaxID=696535 RepID=A0ABW3HU62_9BACL
MKNKLKKSLIAICTLTLLMSMLAACSGSGNDGKSGSGKGDGGEQPDSGSKDKIKISMMYPLSGDAPKRSEAWSWMEEKFGIELDLLAVPANGYLEKVRLTVASGELPDLMVWTQYPDPELVKYVKQGAFRELDNVVVKYDNIMETPEQTFENVKINNKLYSIPRTRPLQTHATYIRKDWLDNLGLPIPKTVEEFAETAIKFTTMDPDQNGKADTFGIGVGENLLFLEQLWMAFDTGNGWRLMEDGSLMSADITPGRKEAIGWLADLYSQNVLDKDFPVTNYTQVNEKFIQGKMGILIGGGVTTYGAFVADAKKLNPSAELIMIDPPVGQTGKQGTPQSAGFYGHWVINAKVSDEKLDKIMEVLNWQATSEALDFKRRGIEGVHHNMVNGEPVITDQFKADGVINLVAHNKFNPYYTTPGASEEIAQAQLDQWKNIEQLGISNPAIAVLTPTMQEKKADLDKLAMENFIAMVIGQQSIDTFDDYVQQWLDKGGKQMTEEVNAWYKEQQQ